MKDQISGKFCVKVKLAIFCCISVINQDHIFRGFIKGGALDNWPAIRSILCCPGYTI